MGIIIVTPSIPIGFWYQSAVNDRQKRMEEVKTKVRIPNVQSIDDIMIEKCKAGDVILFDRRVEKCAAGPLAALSCLVNRTFLCDDDNESEKCKQRTVEIGKFDHCGIVVPGYIREKKDEFDPSNLLLLEATPSQGIAARPLLTRLEMSQSRSVMLLPLACAGEKRFKDNFEMTETQKRSRSYLEKELTKFRDTWVKLSKKEGYQYAHSTLSIAGAISYALGIHHYIPGPISPPAYIVELALVQGAVAQNMNEKDLLATKVEDFLRDHRFVEADSVRLRPGWKFLLPIPMRETS